MNVTSGNMMEDTLVHLYNEVFESYIPEYIKSMEYTPWVFSLLGSAMIGLAGILPLVIIPTESVTKGDKMDDREYLFILYSEILGI